MAEQTIRRGQNTTVQSTPTAAATKNYAGLSFPRVSDTKRTLLSIPLTQILGRTIVAATLQPRVRVVAGQPWAAQTVTVQPIATRWSVDKVTWANQPGVRTGTASTATGALNDGDRFDIDVTALIQQIANGLPNYGWRISTSAGKLGAFYGFAYDDSWVLVVETSDAPETPTALSPSGGVVSRQKFVIRTDFTDLGGSTDQAAIQVQVDPDATAPYAFDSGEVATNVPELDLATTAYAGLADAATTKWRVRVKDTDGYWSDYSAWATVTRATKPTLTLNSPAGGVLGDPTGVVQATISAGTIRFWSVRIVRADDPSDIRWDSGRQPGTGTSFAVTIPARNDDGDRVFRDDTTYLLRIRVWDRLDRVSGGPDDPPFVQSLTSFVFDNDLALAAPTALTLTSSSTEPAVQLTWNRTGSADGWVIHRDGELAAVLEPDDVIALGAGKYTWADREARPNRESTWAVRALVNGKRSAPATKTGIARIDGVWLLSAHGDVRLVGTDVTSLVRKDRRATYSLPGRPDDIDIIGALGGITGAYKGTIGRGHGRKSTADVEAAAAVLRRIRRDPTTPVRLVYSTVSIPVLLRDLNVTPHPERITGVNDLYNVAFECYQVGDFGSW